MIPLFGSEKRLCDGFSRRDLLHIGGLSAFGLTVDAFAKFHTLQAATDEPIASRFGRAKACILLFLFGSPSQHETFDPKPNAPAQIRGEMSPIPTKVSGLQICEGLPRTAQIMDRLTVVRSMTHDFPVHGVAYALTGMPSYTPDIEDKPRDAAHWPFIGSVVDYVGKQRAAGKIPEIPRNIGLPWLFGSQSTDKPPLSGPYAAFLGQEFDPVWTTFYGKPSRVVPKLNAGQSFDVRDHFGGIESKGRFEMSVEGQAPGMTEPRLESRRSLLSQVDESRRWLDLHPNVNIYSQQQ